MPEAPRTVTTTKVYAEHERLHLIHEKSQAIGEFLEWLGGQGKAICDYDWEDGYSKDHISIQDRLAAYFSIDLDKIEQEKREMLAELRIANAEKEIRKELGLDQ